MSQSNPLVTIGIPTYNRADGYLRNALESALSQTYSNIEIIVADNSSTDNTDKLVGSYSNPKIRYYKHPKNIGANANFNFCLEKAKGDFFLLLHDDDLIDSDFVETCIDGIGSKAEIGVIRTGVRTINGIGDILSSTKNLIHAKNVEEFIDQWMNKGKTSVYMCSALYNREELQNIGGFQSPENLYQDIVVEIKLTASMGRLDLEPVKASFRRHEENRGSNTTIYRWAVDSNFVVQLLKNYIDNEKLLKITQYKLSRWNYYRANRIDSTLNRLYSYYINYKLFNYQFPPFFIIKKDIKSLIKKIVQ